MGFFQRWKKRKPGSAKSRLFYCLSPTDASIWERNCSTCDFSLTLIARSLVFFFLTSIYSLSAGGSESENSELWGHQLTFTLTFLAFPLSRKGQEHSPGSRMFLAAYLPGEGPVSWKKTESDPYFP